VRNFAQEGGDIPEFRMADQVAPLCQ
jgi:hypothetical protein